MPSLHFCSPPEPHVRPLTSLPATCVQLGHAALNLLAEFYEEDFGQQNTPRKPLPAVLPMYCAMEGCCCSVPSHLQRPLLHSSIVPVWSATAQVACCPDSTLISEEAPLLCPYIHCCAVVERRQLFHNFVTRL